MASAEPAMAALADSVAKAEESHAPDAEMKEAEAAPHAAAAADSASAAVKSEADSEHAAAAATPAAAATTATVLPSDDTIRTHLRALLAKEELHTLTPKIVRSSLASSLAIADDALLDQLKKKLKDMLPEEIQALNAGKEAEEDQPAAKKQRKSASGSAKKKSASAVAADEEAEALAAAAEDEDNDEDEEEEDESQEDKDAAIAAAMAQEGRRPRRAAAPVSKPRAVRRPKDPNAPKKPPKLTPLSGALSSFFGGVSEMNRGDVVKQLWVYIKANNLQDPKDGRKIILDDKLKTIFGENRRDMFKMNKDLAKHMKNRHQLTDQDE